MTADERIEELAARERSLWVAAFLLYGVGDTVTTFVGLSTAGVAEVGPLAGPLIDAYGRYALLAIKAVTFALFVGLWSVLRPPARTAVPLAMVVVGTAVTAWNAIMIYTAAS